MGHVLLIWCCGSIGPLKVSHPRFGLLLLVKAYRYIVQKRLYIKL